MIRICDSLVILLGLVLLCDCQYDDRPAGGSSSYSSRSSSWSAWTSCSVACGGGTMQRYYSSGYSSGSSYSGGLYDDRGRRSSDSQARSCNEVCHHGGTYNGRCVCPPWREGKCCDNCRFISIPNCKSGKQACGDHPEGIQCTDCKTPYYSAGYNNGCAACPSIANCETRQCTNPANTKCLRCHEDKSLFMRTHSDKKCERMCAWNNHYCWPGECPNNLTSSCTCAPGFHAVKNASETSCQLVHNNTPTIETCETTIVGPHGEQKPGANTPHISICSSKADFYGNFQPMVLSYEMLTSFTVDIGKVLQRPAFISELFKFGITDTSLKLNIHQAQGSFHELKRYNILVDSGDSTNASQMSSDKRNITLPSHTLTNGEWLCITYEVKGGGYLKSIDLRQTSLVPSAPVPYTKTTATRRLCYRYDSASPEHCQIIGTCTIDPLQLPERVTRSNMMSVELKGWTDPIPPGGNSSHASGIESYEITLHEVTASNNMLQVATHSLISINAASDTGPIVLNLTSNIPKLYAIYVEVKDVADNTKTSRRFVLYDNSSKIETSHTKNFIVESALQSTNYVWQIHHNDICLNWTNHFFNKFYLDNPLLSRIEPDPSGLVQGKYDQQTGILPISGTPNVDGIIHFRFAWSLNNGSMSPEVDIPNFLLQHYCQSFSVNDGETYTLNIRAIDIANNSYSENKTVHIDRSVPHINNIWLVKSGVPRLFVHDRTDLSEMNLNFEAIDPHSGIREVRWAFGTSDSGSELLNGTIGVKRKACPANSSDDLQCYCPDVGECEFYQYSLPMNKLVAADKHIGDHNRNYFFTIKVTNHALLSNVEHLDILVDDSPPEKGVVFEGPESSPDYDYTSDESFIVHWHGFIDHESGISSYQIAVSDRCLSKNEMGNTTFVKKLIAFDETPYTDTSTRLTVNFTGKMFTTIVAINNALDMSDPVCSDGITRDMYVPHVTNITIQNGKWKESLICLNGQIWLLDTDMNKFKLNDTVSCSKKCSSITDSYSYPATVPTKEMPKLDDEVSGFMCNTLPAYIQDKTIIYLPNDHIYLTWDVENAGSQINEYYVGIGLDLSEMSNPSQMQYKTTGKKTYFNQHHVGIGSSELFYIFLKAENKAGLTRVSNIGPLLIDETPPLCRAVPDVQITNAYVVVAWYNDTFYDMEQTELIDQVFFQFGHDGRPVTPLMEWRHDSSTDCVGNTGMCIKYKIKRLQQYDTELGLDFYVSLFVYNKARHFLKIDTESFRLPSVYSPGMAVVLDIDPAEDDHNSDINVHFTESIMCGKWSGFRHHEHVTLEFAVGSNSTIDDVISFQHIENLHFYCINSSKLLPGNKYHVLLRSTCSGGSTISASNGVTILTQAYIDTYLKVGVEKYCHSSPLVKGFWLDNHDQHTQLTLNNSFEIGKFYQIYLPENVSISITPGHGILKEINNQYLKSHYSLVPFVHHPLISFVEENKTAETSMIKVVECSNNPHIRVANTCIDSYWYFTEGKMFPVTFEAGVTDRTLKSYQLLEGFVSPSQHSSIMTSSIPIPHNLQPDLLYNIAVRPCVAGRCLDPVLSANITFVFEPPVGNIKEAKINIRDGQDCFDLDLQWDIFKSGSPMMFYQWMLSEDAKAYTTVTEWSTIDVATTLHYQVAQCLRLPHDLYKTMFACVRGYTEAEQSATVCKELQQESRGAYTTNVVYDIDTTSKVWPDIKQVISSSNLGEIYRLLHGTELDFGTASARVAGIVVYGTERIIEWFLMTQPKIPSSCKYSAGCWHYETSKTGYIEFDMEYIKPNTIYYICAMSNSTNVEREMFTESFEEFHACSDGFVLDDAPPSAGKIHVTHTNGYLTDPSRTLVSWDGFYDNVDATKLGYINSIKSYSFAVGSRAGGDDILSFSEVGLSKVAVANITTVADGVTVFFTVRASDQSGLTTHLSSEELTVDTSPPTTGIVLLNGQYDIQYVTTDTLKFLPSGFHDDESGIQRYEISVGSAYDTEDLLKSIEVTGEIDLTTPKDSMHDGNAYYITVKAINRAGLESLPVRIKLIYDSSPPTGGSVLDGDGHQKRDIDFQTDLHHIKSHWIGYDDIQSGIKTFRVGLGLSPYDDDVESITDVGLNTDITWNGSFVPGQKYYTVLEACNNAGLCTKKTSNGIILDNSPPIHGLVRVGSANNHQSYIPLSSSIHLHWHGFEDPQSGIERFDACIGTKAGMCDVKQMFDCLLQSNILKSGLTLAANTHLYATVYAYNKAGMRVEQSSDAFMVDESPPSIISQPVFVLDNKSIKGFQIQWEPSLLSIYWRFEDSESPITGHTVTLKTHHEGHTPVENIHLGNVNNLTLSLDGDNWLKSGDKYFVMITSCNAAGHCSTAQSKDLLIDSSPPHLGGFRPPMTWNTYPGRNTSDVSLTWYGFHDQESEIARYCITLSRSYSGHELSNGEIVTTHNLSSDQQHTTITLQEQLKRDDLLIMSIWAQNHAGLNSSIARVTVNVLSISVTSIAYEGVLELEKHSCDAHYCNGDCTCAVIGKPCTGDGISDNCSLLNNTDVLSNNFPTVEVYGGLESHPQQITASSACLFGHWRLSTLSDRVSRFEWSMGLVNQPIGEGIFNLKQEISWKDVGLQKEVVYCLHNMSLLHNEEYVINVRVWYSSYQSAIFTSNSIIVDQTPPVVRRGRSIKDSDPTCEIDLDFIDWMDTITACWANVFSEQQSNISHYVVSLGTSPNADDVFSSLNVGLNTSLTLTNLTLAHGTKYYFSVTAFNNVGLHTSLSSDGFVVDMDNPTAGVVYNTGSHVNAAFQSSNDRLSVSWHGFIDRYSGIRSYHVGMIEGELFNESRVAFHNVGLRNSFTFTNLNLEQGQKYLAAVKALDAAGHESVLSISPTLTIDTTPPEGFVCLAYQEIIYEEQLCAPSGVYNISSRVNFNRMSCYKVVGYMTEYGTAEVTLESLRVSLLRKIADNGSSHFEYIFLPHNYDERVLEISGLCQANTSVSMRLSSCSEMKPGLEAAVKVQQIAPTAIQIQWMIHDPESRVKRIKVGLGSTPGGFQIKDLSEVHRDSNGFAAVNVPHGTRVFATVTADNHAGLWSIFHAKPITMDKTPPFFTTRPTVMIEDMTNMTQQVAISWSALDGESGIKQCFCGLGKQPFSRDLRGYFISDSSTTCRMENISLADVDIIYATVMCINGAELASETSSDQVVVSKDPPSAHNAVVIVVPESDQLPTQMMTNQHIPVQSNLTCIRMQWSDFSDVLGIDRFEYRLKHGEIPVTYWADAGRQTMASIDGLHLQTGSLYTTEVRAVNVGHYISDAVHADVLVLGTGPMLSGKTIKMKVSGEAMNLDWSEVFILHKDAAVGYALTIGTMNGYNDVIDHFVTTGNSHSFDIPSATLISPSVNELFIELSSVYSSGRPTLYRTGYKLA